MTPESALQLAQFQDPNGSMSSLLRLAFDIYKQNNHSSYSFPYGEVDFLFQEFIEEADLSQREKDLIYISNFFHYSWKTLHLGIIFENRKPNEYEVDTILKTFYALTRLNLQNKLLMNDNVLITNLELMDLLGVQNEI
jgi:hypothetical protein